MDALLEGFGLVWNDNGRGTCRREVEDLSVGGGGTATGAMAIDFTADGGKGWSPGREVRLWRSRSRWRGSRLSGRGREGGVAA